MKKKDEVIEEKPSKAAAKKEAKKKAKEAKPQGPRSGLENYSFMAMGSGALSIILGSLVVYFLIVIGGQRLTEEKLLKSFTQQYVQYFNTVLESAIDTSVSISSNKAIHQSLLSKDPVKIEAMQKAILADTGDKLIAATIIPADVLLTDYEGLGFVEKSLIEKVRSHKPAMPEIINKNSKTQLLIVKNILNPDEKKIPGTMLLAFDFNLIASSVSGFDPAAGRVTLMQSNSSGSKKRAVFKYGTPKASSSSIVQQKVTAQPNLTVKFSLVEGISEAKQNAIVFFSILAIQVILAAGAIFFVFRKMQQKVRKNMEMVKLLGESIIKEGRTIKSQEYSVETFEELAASLSQSFMHAKPRSSQKTVTTKVDDLTANIKTQDAALLTSTDDITIAEEIFRAYDIRGIVDTQLTPEVMVMLGRSIASEALEQGQTSIAVAWDGRLSGPDLESSLVEGIISTGCNAITIDSVPTPLLYYATHNLETKSGIMITGSHNPPEYNGLKIVINDHTLSGDEIRALHTRIVNKDFKNGQGSISEAEVAEHYMDTISQDIVLARSMKIVIDAGNGIAGSIAPQLFETLGCEIIPLYCDVDGSFPNHHPDPSKAENLQDLIEAVANEGADLGIAFDGDGDRLGVVTEDGKIIYPDRLMMLFAKDILLRNPGADIIFDVKCSRELATLISANSGRPLMWKTGHSLIKTKLKETDAPLAGEMSGHIFFNDRWYGFDDAIYSAARLIEILSLEAGTVGETFAELPELIGTPEINIAIDEDKKFQVIEDLKAKGNFGKGNITDIDGVRVDFPVGWGLVRASNTTPALVTRFEAKTEETLKKIQKLFRDQLDAISPGMDIPFPPWTSVDNEKNDDSTSL